MSYIIAVTGKGGVGKTTCAALLVTQLIRNNKRPVLAVDADPNNCLDAALGVQTDVTIGGVREEARQIAGKGMASGISKQQLLELKISESLVEADDFDLITMGRPEGPGCYCYANNVLKAALGEIASNYPYVVLDNEAGLENLSRRIVQKVNLMVMVTDPSARGVDTIKRLFDLTHEMGVEYDKLAIIINRLRSDREPRFINDLQNITNADFIVALPENSELADYAEDGKSFISLPDNNDVVVILKKMIADIGI